ncbi:WD40/YVTN repeat-like-containing domain superfamily [Sesbania bispinosa]|nr:WD40/YVTN repeat-like-containing domain superfamily [Sesbania bispinosa]
MENPLLIRALQIFSGESWACLIPPVLVKNMSLYGKLDGHEGCVNAVEFNSTGDLLVSGSDDKQVIFWNWASKTKLFAYPSGHSDNIFQTKIMPFTDDQQIVTSAGDGQVRLGLLQEDGRVDTTLLGKHHGSVYKLAVEPGSPYILYSCGEDGFIQHFDLRSSSATKLFCCHSLIGNKKQSPSKIRLNSIVIDSRNPYYFAVGGSDEYARVYDIRKCQWDAVRNSDRPVNTFCPQHLMGQNNVHITGLAYSSLSELLVSYNDELIYLLRRIRAHVPSPSSGTSEELKNLHEAQVYSGHRNAQTVKGIIEANRQGREDRSRVTLTPDVIMHVLRLQRRQTLAYIERRYTRADIVSDEEDAERYLLGFPDGDVSSERILLEIPEIATLAKASRSGFCCCWLTNSSENAVSFIGFI